MAADFKQTARARVPFPALGKWAKKTEGPNGALRRVTESRGPGRAVEGRCSWDLNAQRTALSAHLRRGEDRKSVG